MSGSFAQKDNVLFEQQSLGQSIRAVVPELPAEVWVSALALHGALGISPSLAREVTLNCATTSAFRREVPVSSDP